MSIKTLKAIPLAALVAAALIAGCGDRDETTPRTTATPPDSTGTSTTSPAGSTNSAAATGSTTSGNSSSSTGTPSMAGGSPAQRETTTAAGGSTATAPAGGAATGAATPATPASPTAGRNAPAGSVGAGGAELAMVDRNFVTTAAAGGLFEVEAAKLATDKATDPAVKAFATMLVEHHTQVNDELKQLASTKNVTLPTELPADKKAQLNKLQSVSGAAFDRQFVQEIGIRDHQQDIRSFEKASRDAKDPQVKSWAQKTLPTLREHYSKAQTLPGGGEKEPTTGRATTHDGSETRGDVAGATGTTGGSTAAAGGATAAGANNSATPPPPSSR